MENSLSNSVEGMVDAMQLEDYQWELSFQDLALSGPGDEDEDESEEEGEEDGGSGGNNDEDPPLDEDIVHSPVPLQSGGKP